MPSVKHLFAVILLSIACISLHAQDRRWDAALDQYQQICDECIDLRARSASGERIQAASVAQLLSKLSSLRNTLQEAKGQMTPAQRLRFESIRMRYEEVFGGPRAERLPQVDPSAWLPLLVETPQSMFVQYPSQFFGSMPFIAPAAPDFGIILYAGVPDMYYGGMLMLQGKRFGGFVKGSLSIPYTRGEYECFSDGTTPGGYIWTSGAERLSRWSVTAGATYTPWHFVTVYAGGGYGSRQLLWQDVSGRWATVSDRSVAAFAADAGLVFNLGSVSVLAGASTIGFRNITAEFGIGLRF